MSFTSGLHSISVRVAAGLALIVASTVAAEAQSYDLKYTFEPGQELDYSAAVDIQQTQEIGGGPQPVKIETVIKSEDVSTRRFIEVNDDGDLLVDTENKQLKVFMKITPLGEYRFDSSEATHETGSLLGSALTPLYETMSGAIIRLEMSPRGEIKDVIGLEELVKPVLKNNPLAEQFGAGATKAGAKLSYSDMYVQFPDRAIEVDESWEVPYTLNLPKLGEAKGKKVYKFRGPVVVEGRKLLKIEVTNEMDFELNVDSDGVTVGGTLSAEDSRGVILFDEQLGQVYSVDSSTVIKGDLNVVAAGNNLTIKQDQTQKIQVKLVEDSP